MFYNHSKCICVVLTSCSSESIFKRYQKVSLPRMHVLFSPTGSELGYIGCRSPEKQLKGTSIKNRVCRLCSVRLGACLGICVLDFFLFF